VSYSGRGKECLYPAPPDEHTIFETDLSGLLVPKTMWESVVWQKGWRKLGIEEVSVVDPPTDGVEIPLDYRGAPPRPR
jgi:hypothetical protein